MGPTELRRSAQVKRDGSRWVIGDEEQQLQSQGNDERQNEGRSSSQQQEEGWSSSQQMQAQSSDRQQQEGRSNQQQLQKRGSRRLLLGMLSAAPDEALPARLVSAIKVRLSTCALFRIHVGPQHCCRSIAAQEWCCTALFTQRCMYCIG